MINKKIGLMALLAGLAVGEVMAGSLTSYNIGDVLICFRNGQTRNLVVDAGPISTFTNAAPNQRITISQYTSSQFDAAFGDVDDVDWSAFTWFDDSVSPASAEWTLFMTKQRTDLNIQSTPWSVGSAGSQQSVASLMAEISTGASFKLGFNTHNTANAIIEPQAASGYLPQQGTSYFNAINSSIGLTDFGGNFSGSPEIFTGDDFDSSGTVLRSDFYQIPPGSGSSTFLGYFEMATDGTMSYVAYPTATPIIQSLTRSNDTSTITCITGTYGTYTLRGTDTLGTSPTNWPVIVTVPNGTTSVQTVNDTDSSPNKFYIITAQ